MNDRKKHVIKKAHQLFIDKGFQATSIQDILNYSGISKGTFYNYFSSKSELLIAIFTSSYADLEKLRNDLLIGQSPSDIEVFINQIEMQLKANRKNNMLPLFEEVLVSDDEDLKKFIEKGRIRNIHWIYQRLIDIFGEKKKPFLLDCAIMFTGILRENIKFNRIANHSKINIGLVVRYSVNRLVKIVDEVSAADEQLIKPDILDTWLPDCKQPDHSFHKRLRHAIFTLRNEGNALENQERLNELLSFIEEELLDSKQPRQFLIDSIIMTLKTVEGESWEKELEELEQLIGDFFNQMKE